MIIPLVGIAAETTGSHKISRRNTIPQSNIDLEAKKEKWSSNPKLSKFMAGPI
jgi:hypothetical protein